MMRMALITNTPPPYRVPIFNRLAQTAELDFHAIFCTAREPNRCWDLPDLHCQSHVLRECFLTRNGRYIHNNPDVVPLLQSLNPDVLITDGFNPTHLYAFLFAKIKRRAHVAMTDGTAQSERSLSSLHRLVRRLVYRSSHSFIAASDGGQALYRSYAIAPEHCFYSYLCIDNDVYMPAADEEKIYDFIFCGRLEAEKNPLFALEVACKTAHKTGKRMRLLVVGSGSQEAVLRAAAQKYVSLIDVHFHGFATQQELPALYRSARLFLFPTHADVWGIVANEACAAGLPVLVSPHAGVAGELVLDGCNGYVRALDADVWAQAACTLLRHPRLWRAFSLDGLDRVRRYNFDSAAQGIVRASEHALARVSTTGKASNNLRKPVQKSS